ncbi:hypothetical protein [Polymorphobacter megasporae]|uniref:hypothetical protein n=1 Tax=Glacieibacterium megasporae TaxID=2835787 RepID=UPI001C1E36D6|nr:hypothetical protein [Polymorphobacter megasporae]UAJ10589.1 hypothetical protein KTC28_02175 [Polymorphobacter megasporae]
MASIVENQASPVTRIAPPNDDIRATVDQTEKMVARAPLIILAVLVGLPVVASLISLHIGSAIFGGVIMFIIAGFAIKLVNALIITPLKTARYKRAASTLAGQVQSVSEPVSFWRSWWSGAPGALAVTKLGHVVIVDRSTNYAQLWLGKSQIVNVSVEREATQVTNTKHGGRMTFGGVSNGLFGGYAMGGRSKSVTQTLETAFLEIRYQLEPNGYVSTVVIPYGSDRRAADELCAVVTRIEHTA